MRTRKTLLLLCVPWLAVGCGDRGKDFEQRRDLLEPLSLDSTIVLIDLAAPQAFLFDATAEPLANAATVVELPEGPAAVLRRNGEDEALVLCTGRRATQDQAETPATLVALGPDGKQRRYELGNPFGTVKQSEDGRYAFLLKGDVSDRLLDNPNEVAIVDLEAKASSKGAVTLRTLRSFGDSPSSVVFSPTMRIADEDRRLAVVLSDTNVTLLDLDHLDRRETTVQLSSDTAAGVTPSQIVFNPEAPEIYVRSDNSRDVFVFNLSPRAEGEMAEDDEPRNDFRPFIDQLGVGGTPSDLSLYSTEATGTRLLVLSSGSRSGVPAEATVVDPSTSRVTAVELPEYVSSTLLFTATSPRDDAMRSRAMLYEPGNYSVMFLDLEDLEERGSRNLEVLSLQQPIKRIVPMLEEGRALALHDGQTVSLIDLAGRTVTPIAASVPLDEALFDHARRRLWVGPAGQRYVGWLDLDTGDTREVLLDANIEHVLPLFTSDRVAVLHASRIGYATVLDADEPTREAARSVRGFLAADLLDIGE